MITRKGLHAAHLKLELESAEHVIGVLKHQIPNRNKSREMIDKEISIYEEIRDKLINTIFEEAILIGEDNE